MTLLFPKESDGWISHLRIGLGIQLVLYCLSSRREWIATFMTGEKIVSARDVSETLVAMESSLIPRLEWFLRIAAGVGIPGHTALWMIWSVILLSGGMLIAGVLCRPAAVTGWLLHLACVKSGDVFAYGMDNFLTIGLFYLMLSPLPDSAAIDRHIWKFRPPDARMSGFFRRVLQLHLCIVYFFSGVAKCLGHDWWTGMNVWAALTREPFNALNPTLVAEWWSMLPLVGIGICMIELGYPVFIWWRRTRTIWLGAVLGMHAAIGITMGMYLFALVMITLNIAAFAPGPRRVRRGYPGAAAIIEGAT